jgi:hypothetical protein
MLATKDPRARSLLDDIAKVSSSDSDCRVASAPVLKNVAEASQLPLFCLRRYWSAK